MLLVHTHTTKGLIRRCGAAPLEGAGPAAAATRMKSDSQQHEVSCWLHSSRQQRHELNVIWRPSEKLAQMLHMVAPTQEAQTVGGELPRWFFFQPSLPTNQCAVSSHVSQCVCDNRSSSEEVKCCSPEVLVLLSHCGTLIPSLSVSSPLLTSWAWRQQQGVTNKVAGESWTPWTSWRSRSRSRSRFSSFRRLKIWTFHSLGTSQSMTTCV